MSILRYLEYCVDTYFAYMPRQRPSVKTAQDIRLVAHRGAHDASLSVLENTLAAFERAYRLGCYGIELDIHACADGTLVVNHDPDLKRLWGHDVAIKDVSYEKLNTLAPLVPRLSEVIALYGKKMHLFIELKTPFQSFEALSKALSTLTPSIDYHLISLDETVFPEATLFPKASLLLIPVHNNVSRFCNLSLQQQYGGVLGHYLLLRNKHIQQLQNAHQMVGVGIVDSKYGLYRELRRGLPMLFSNNVAELTSCLQSLQPER